MPAINDYFFGVWHPIRVGHYLHVPSGQAIHSTPNDFPFQRYQLLDGSLLPVSKEQTEGLATFCHINGWSVISFWDRSGDGRTGSSSTFLTRGKLDFQAACDRAKEMFPSVWQRFKFEVRERSDA